MVEPIRVTSKVALDLNAPQASAAEFGGLVGQAAERFGQQVENTGIVLEEHRQRKMLWDAELTIAEDKVKQMEAFEEAKRNAPPGAEGFTDQFKEAFTQHKNELVANAPSRQVQAYMTRQLDQSYMHFLPQAMEFEAKSQATQNANRLQSTLENYQNIVRADPRQLAELEASMTQLIDNTPFWDNQIKDTVKREQIQSLNDSALQGFVASVTTGPNKDNPAIVERALAYISNDENPWIGKVSPQAFSSASSVLESAKDTAVRSQKVKQEQIGIEQRLQVREAINLGQIKTVEELEQVRHLYGNTNSDVNAYYSDRATLLEGAKKQVRVDMIGNAIETNTFMPEVTEKEYEDYYNDRINTIQRITGQPVPLEQKAIQVARIPFMDEFNPFVEELNNNLLSSSPEKQQEAYQAVRWAKQNKQNHILKGLDPKAKAMSDIIYNRIEREGYNYPEAVASAKQITTVDDNIVAERNYNFKNYTKGKQNLTFFRKKLADKMGVKVNNPEAIPEGAVNQYANSVYDNYLLTNDIESAYEEAALGVQATFNVNSETGITEFFPIDTFYARQNVAPDVWKENVNKDLDSIFTNEIIPEYEELGVTLESIPFPSTRSVNHYRYKDTVVYPVVVSGSLTAIPSNGELPIYYVELRDAYTGDTVDMVTTPGTGVPKYYVPPGLNQTPEDSLRATLLAEQNERQKRKPHTFELDFSGVQ
jgi:hypothetical protein